MGNKLTYPTVDLSGKVAIVTGGNTGIGYETAKALAEMGAHTFIACRSQERAAAAVDRMKQEVGEGKELKVEYLLVDLASFSSVKDFVRTFREKNLPLHILVNNAGIAWVPYSQTEDGLEIQLQVNHLSPLLLTLELLPVMLDSASSSDGDGRIVFLSSRAHSGGSWNPATINPQTEAQYERMKTYGNTKMYNTMTVYALQRRLANTAITVSSVDPGIVRTEVFRGYADLKAFTFLAKVVLAVGGKEAKEGAATSVNCAVNPELNTRVAHHYIDCRATPSSQTSRNEDFQEDLWRRSFDFLKDHLSPETIQNYCPPNHEEERAQGETETAREENSCQPDSVAAESEVAPESGKEANDETEADS